MTLTELLVARGLQSALIIDDAYDAVPRAEDLANDDDAWANFFADLGPDATVLAANVPDFANTDASVLKRSDTFVATVWNLRGTLREELWSTLFERYSRAAQAELQYLARLEAALQGFGLGVIQSGRNVPAEARTAPIIFADLFLGSSQTDQDIETSIERLQALVAGREEAPPIVVLISRSARLADKKKYFRDSVPLLSAMFRVHAKQDLLEGLTLQQTLERLVRHYEDAHKLARFIQSWNTGLDQATKRFLRTIRRLDLADYSQIRRLLLDFEGQPIGSYLLDIFDRLLQFEIEADPRTIAAAEGLNQVNAEDYPPPYIAGTPDLQELVHGCIYQHPNRLAVKATIAGAPVSFGDILVPGGAAAGGPGNDEVLVVLTPACDLARPGAKRVLLMSGVLEALDSDDWTYQAKLVRTPILIMPDGARKWVRWDVKDLRTLTLTELTAALAPGGTQRIVLRLRDAQALELQQRVLSDLGRVGLVAPMPATFHVTVELHFVNADGAMQHVPAPSLERDGGVCYVGRNEAGDTVSRLIISEDVCREIVTAISAIDENSVYPQARAALQELRGATAFSSMLDRGIVIPAPTKKTWMQLRIPVVQDGQAVQRAVGLVRRNPDGDDMSNQEKRYGGFLLTVRDPKPEAAAALASTVE
jgi:hypothetical protein